MSITTQTALELAVADITPIVFTCGIVRINTTADNLHGIITMAVTTAHPAGQYKPQVCIPLVADNTVSLSVAWCPRRLHVRCKQDAS